jgi:hypothetical protein
LEAAFGAIERFVSERKRMEAAALNVGKKAWGWLVSRSQSTRLGFVIAAGVVVGGWLAGEPIGQILELLIRRLLGLP